MAWITSSLKVYDPRDWVSSSNSPCNYEMIRDQENVTKKGKFGPNTLPISRRSRHRNVGCLFALARRYKPPTRLHLLVLPSVIRRHCKTAEQGHHLLRAGRVVHSYKHTEEVVKQKT